MVEGLTELSACKVGLVGFGDIARAAAERLAPFGCELYYYTKHRRTPEEERKYGITYLPLEELAERSDIVSLHCPLTDETAGLINKDTLALMKPSAMLVNTSRGGAVVERDLADALNSGKIAAAALDVLDREPMDVNCPLRNAKNCCITPHIAWAPLETRIRLIDMVSDNLKNYLAGHPANNVAV